MILNSLWYGFCLLVYLVTSGVLQRPAWTKSQHGTVREGLILNPIQNFDYYGFFFLFA